jgi:osmotically-inducible protein OsmY
MKTHLKVAALLAAGALTAAPSYGAERTGDIKDAWITGKLEAVYALNRHLEGYAIDTDTQNGVVHLTGTVESDIDRDLAGEIAKGIEGVTSVDNDLKVASGSRKPATSSGDDRPFGVWIDDATTTAAVKSKLLANPNTKGLKIDVDTRADVVTLRGEVSSSEEKQLAEELAKNSGDVKEVRNQLVVSRG